MSAERTWSDIFAAGTATPALLVGIAGGRWASLLARLLGPPSAEPRHVLVITASERDRQIIRSGLPLSLRRAVYVITQCHLVRDLRGLGAFDAVLWIGLTGLFDEESGTFDDVCSADDERVLSEIIAFCSHFPAAEPLPFGPIYVATRSPAHAALPNCLVPERMLSMDADMRAAVAAQFNMRFSNKRTWAEHGHRRPTVVGNWFGFMCARDGEDALLQWPRSSLAARRS